MKKEFNEFIENMDVFDYRISYILTRQEEETESFYCFAISKDEPDEAIEIEVDSIGNKSISNVLDWDYDVDNYLFSDLEDGSELQYMTIDTHSCIWEYIHNNYYEIENNIGMQKYLKYCKTHDIDFNVIKHIASDTYDAMKYYQEVNEGYHIIHESNINKTSFVIGENNNFPFPYVVWKTSENRKIGYTSESYFNNIQDAYNNVKERCSNELNKCINRNLEKGTIKYDTR